MKEFFRVESLMKVVVDAVVQVIVEMVEKVVVGIGFFGDEEG